MWYDWNRNGLPDPGEPGIGGVRIQLWKKGLIVRVATTLEDGRFTFSYLYPGTYDIVEQDPRGYRSTTSNRVTVVLTGNQTVEVDFGDVRIPVQHTAIPFILR